MRFTSLSRTFPLWLATLLTVGWANPVAGDILTTNPANNGSGGIFLNLTASGTEDLTWDGFATYFGSGTIGSAATIQIWTRPNSYVGFQNSSSGWTLTDTVTGFSNGANVSADIALNSSLTIAAGTTLGVYLHSTTLGNGIRYTGTGFAPPQTTFSDANLTLFSGHARTFATPFGGNLFTPRAFAGRILYSVASVPEPNVGFAVIIFVTVVGSARRRRWSPSDAN